MQGLCIVCIVFSCPCNMVYIIQVHLYFCPYSFNASAPIGRLSFYIPTREPGCRSLRSLAPGYALVGLSARSRKKQCGYRRHLRGRIAFQANLSLPPTIPGRCPGLLTVQPSRLKYFCCTGDNGRREEETKRLKDKETKRQREEKTKRQREEERKRRRD